MLIIGTGKRFAAMDLIGWLDSDEAKALPTSD
jgi:hypothetical protein